MNWSSFVISISSILLAAFSTYWAYKDRTSAFQKYIHEEQVSLITKIFKRIQNLFLVSIAITYFDISEIQNAKVLGELEDIINAKKQVVNKEFLTYSENELLLPSNILESKNNIFEDFNKLITERENLTQKQKANLIDKVNSERIKFISASRKLIGTDELSQKNINLFSSLNDIKNFISE